jgi:hypothetical protein
LRVFRSRTLTGANLIALVSAAVIGAQGFFSTLYMQQVLGYSPITTGMAFLPLTIAIMATAAVHMRCRASFKNQRACQVRCP